MVTLICSGWQCRLLWNHPSAIDLKERWRRPRERGREPGDTEQHGKILCVPSPTWSCNKSKAALSIRSALCSSHSQCTTTSPALWFVLEACICTVWFAIVPGHVSYYQLNSLLLLFSMPEARFFFFLSHAGFWLISSSMLLYFNLEWEISDFPRLLRKIKL